MDMVDSFEDKGRMNYFNFSNQKYIAKLLDTIIWIASHIIFDHEKKFDESTKAMLEKLYKSSYSQCNNNADPKLCMLTAELAQLLNITITPELQAISDFAYIVDPDQVFRAKTLLGYLARLKDRPITELDLKWLNNLYDWYDRRSKAGDRPSMQLLKNWLNLLTDQRNFDYDVNMENSKTQQTTLTLLKLPVRAFKFCDSINEVNTWYLRLICTLYNF